MNQNNNGVDKIVIKVSSSYVAQEYVIGVMDYVGIENVKAIRLDTCVLQGSEPCEKERWPLVIEAKELTPVEIYVSSLDTGSNTKATEHMIELLEYLGFADTIDVHELKTCKYYNTRFERM